MFGDVPQTDVSLPTMDTDQDRARRAIANSNLTAEAVNSLSSDAYGDVPFADLATLKNLLKTFFSEQAWTSEHDDQLAELVGDVGGSWKHTLSNGATLEHGMEDGRYRLSVRGGQDDQPARLFNRLFEGPIIPEATPNPRHIRFPLGGAPGTSLFYQRGDPIDDERVMNLFEDPNVTDVLVAPDFVAIGLSRAELWESRIDELLAAVTAAFEVSHTPPAAGTPTRDELVAGSRSTEKVDLHLLDPDSPGDRSTLLAALIDGDPRRRRLAVATIGNTRDEVFLRETLDEAWTDSSRIVRRTAVDVAVDRSAEWARPLLEQALGDADAWTRWKALRGLVDIGPASSFGFIQPLREDSDFRVRLEAHSAYLASTGHRDAIERSADKLERVRIEIAPTPETAAERAALAIADSLIGSARDPLFGLAGGSTPQPTYEHLARLDVDWSRVIGFVGDERWVPIDHPDSNVGMIRRTSLGQTGLRILEIQYGDDPDAAAAGYEADLHALGSGADPAVLLLGMGDDGHTASLFPGTPALEVSGQDYVANWVDDKQTWRLTATFDLIARVDHVMFLVIGAAKADRVAEVLAGNSDLPAARATRVARQATWFLDQAAASRLDR